MVLLVVLKVLSLRHVTLLLDVLVKLAVQVTAGHVGDPGNVGSARHGGESRKCMVLLEIDLLALVDRHVGSAGRCKRQVLLVILEILLLLACW